MISRRRIGYFKIRGYSGHTEESNGTEEVVNWISIIDSITCSFIQTSDNKDSRAITKVVVGFSCSIQTDNFRVRKNYTMS